MDWKQKRELRNEKIRALLEKPWAAYTAAACAAVILYMLLSHFDFLLSAVRSLFGILSPILIGIVLAYIMNPLVKVFEDKVFGKMKRKNARHLIAVILSIVVFLIVVAGLIVLLVPSITKSVTNIVSNFQSYRGTLERYLNNAEQFMANLGLNTEKISIRIEEWFGKLTELIADNMDVIFSTTKSVGSGMINFFIGFVLMAYFLIGRDSLLEGIDRLRRAVLSKEAYENHTAFLSRSNKIFIRFIVLNILDAVIIGVLNAIFMLALRMPYVPFISMLVGVTNLVPTFGPIFGAALSAIILLLNGHPWLTLIFLAFSIVLQSLDSYVIKPKMYGEGFGVPGIWIVIAIIIFGKIFGMVGMLLAVPLAAILTIIYHEYVLIRMQENREEKEQKIHAAAEAMAGKTPKEEESGPKEP